jgi:two-component system sensor histidine kinase and response regulator WspE
MCEPARALLRAASATCALPCAAARVELRAPRHGCAEQARGALPADRGKPRPLRACASRARAPARAAPGRGADRGIKVAAQTLNRLMGLAGESLVQSRWFEPFSESLLDLKRRHSEINDLLESLQSFVEELSGSSASSWNGAAEGARNAATWAAEQQTQLDAFGIRSAGLSDRLYREVVASRMRPFGDGVEGFPRLVRDLARQLGKQAQLEIVGTNTEVDREILDRLEAPLNHAIRNSLDHGIERPDERVAAGKPPSGTIRIEARHRAGLFVLTVSDDGRGVDIEALRAL